MRVLALDQGTSATKAVVFEEDGAIVSSAESAVTPRAVAGGGVEQDPEQLWDSVRQAGREAIARAGGDVGAIGFANQGETVLAWDRQTGRPLGAALSWQDRRAAAVCADMANHAAQLTQITGLPLDPYFAAPKMAWLRQHGASDGVVTTSDSWLLHRLTGAYVTDVTTASRTMLLDLGTRTWSEDACALFGLGVSDLPAVVGCAEGIGETDAFGPSLAVTGLSVDQQAALIGEQCLEAGDSKCTYGTGAFLLANAGAQPFTSSAGLAVSVAWQVGDLAAYCIDGQVYAAGAAIAWLVRWGFLAKPEELDAVASSVPDAGGVTVVPALTGLGAPWWEPDALAAMEGIGPATQPAHVVRATVEGLAAQVAVLARAAATDLGRPLTRLRVDGGLTNSRLLMQTQADLLGVPVEVASSPHATAAGVGALARLGTDPGRTLESVVGRTESPTSYEPTVPAEVAGERLARFERAVALRVDAARGTAP
jgi:glycerol kinase